MGQAWQCLLTVMTILGLFPMATYAWSVEKILLDWFKNSNVVSKLHEEHVASEYVQHMFKGTPLVSAPDNAKMEFAEGPLGSMLAQFMASEQEILGDWKVGKIVEAAGADFDEEEAKHHLEKELTRSAVTMFSFVDCPWCLLGKRLISGEPYCLADGDGVLRVVELEELGRKGKALRAAIALETGRTSMPAVFIGGKAIGGYTDGMPGLKKLHEDRKLVKMIDVAKSSSNAML